MNNFKKQFPNVDESNYTKFILERILDKDIKSKLENSLTWYQRKAKISKILYYVLMISSILCNASIPIINTINGSGQNSILVSIIATIAGVSMSVMTLFHFKDNWQRYRKSAELLKSETFKYIKDYGDYDCEGKIKDDIFIEKIDNISTSENTKWAEMRRDHNDSISS